MTAARVVVAVIAVALVVGVAVVRGDRYRATVAADGAVVRVVDGDTIDVQGAGRVRILLIDTPETSDNSHAPKGCYAQAAKDFLSDLLPTGQQVDLVTDRDDRDRYGRLLAYVEVDGVDIGRQVVAAGLARVVYYKPNGARLDDYIDVEDRARDSLLGIWGPSCAA